MNISDKIFLVTGAGGGIGGELAMQLLEKGAKVAAVDLRQESLDKLKESAGKNGEALTLHAVDITDGKVVTELPQKVVEAQGNIDAIINCAGIIQPFVKVNELEYEAIERVMNINFYGTLYMTKAFLPYLLKRPEAYVANVSSMGGFLPVPGQSVYGASKAAVKLLTEGLYAELLDTNVRVSIIFPGATKTNISANSNVSGPKQATSDTEKSKIPMLSPQEAAAQIIRGIEKNKPQIFTGKDSNFLNLLYRLNPVFATKLIAKQMRSLLSK
jgi:short-subunit dehydrogenase